MRYAGAMIERISRRLDSDEIRVLGCLLEKQQATPEYYPLTENALVAACNQRSNRNPVLSLSESAVHRALERLHHGMLVTRVTGRRATKWGQQVEKCWRLDRAGKAVLTVLLLRGPQTAGEIRARTVRLYEFATADSAEAALAELAAPPDPLVVLLERAPGQKEPRWGHRVGIDDDGEYIEPVETHAPRPAAEQAAEAAPAGPPGGRAQPTTAPPAANGPAGAMRDFDPDLVMRRLERLEQKVQDLESALRGGRGRD